MGSGRFDVANELRWIRQSAKDVGQVLRDYRNYIHPEKELSHGVTVDGQDTAMFVKAFCSIAGQIIASVKTWREWTQALRSRSTWLGSPFHAVWLGRTSM